MKKATILAGRGASFPTINPVCDCALDLKHILQSSSLGQIQNWHFRCWFVFMTWLIFLCSLLDHPEVIMTLQSEIRSNAWLPLVHVFIPLLAYRDNSTVDCLCIQKIEHLPPEVAQTGGFSLIISAPANIWEELTFFNHVPLSVTLSPCFSSMMLYLTSHVCDSKMLPVILPVDSSIESLPPYVSDRVLQMIRCGDGVCEDLHLQLVDFSLYFQLICKVSQNDIKWLLHHESYP